MSARPKINFTEEQEMLLEIATKFAHDKSPFDKVRGRAKAAARFDSSLWQEMVDLGWTALTLDESDGGSGLGLGEAITILEPFGKHLFATPLAHNFVAALVGKALGGKALVSALGAGAQATLAVSEPNGAWELDRLEARAESVGATFTFSGTKTLITHADSAEALLLFAKAEAGISVFQLERADFADKLVKEKVIDETQSSFCLPLDSLVVGKERLLGVVSAPVKVEIERWLTLLLAAQMCGALAGVLDLILGYLTMRKQFGKFIGSYQSLKHPAVDILLGLEAARSHLYYAAGLDARAPAGAAGSEAMLAARMAKAQASDAFTFAADRAIQFHGAFGFTYDCDAQLFLRRALWSEYQMGDSAYQRQKIAEEVL